MVEPAMRAGAERHHVDARAGVRQAAPIALEHLDIGEQMMGEQDGLGALEMGVAGQHGIVPRVRHDPRARAGAHARPEEMASISSRQIEARRSVATWSLRLRAVCSFAPARRSAR